MNALIKKLEILGFEMLVEKGYHFPTTEIIIYLFEKVHQINHILTEKEKKDLKKYPSLSLAPKWDYKPTGLLIREIDSWGSYAVRKQCSDIKSSLREDKLQDFVVSLIKNADLMRQRRLEQEEQERRLIIELSKQEELERQRREEEERRRDLENQAGSWIKAQQLRAYIDEIERSANGKKAPFEKKERLEKWLAWARQHANRIDPLRGFYYIK